VLLRENGFAAEPGCPAAAAAEAPAALGTAASASSGGRGLCLLDAHASLHRIVRQNRRQAAAHLPKQCLQHRGLRLAAAAAAGASAECRVNCRVRRLAATCACPTAALALAAVASSAVLVLACKQIIHAPLLAGQRQRS
jgi:hypothetical protein